MSSRRGTRVDHDTFCKKEGWDDVRNARGKPVRHHVTYELPLPSGKVLRTRVSRPVKAETYGPQLWSAILRDQLEVTEDQFWSCVDDGVKPNRETEMTTASANALPLQLVRLLQKDLHLSDDAIARLDRTEALSLLNDYWSLPPD